MNILSLFLLYVLQSIVFASGLVVFVVTVIGVFVLGLVTSLFAYVFAMMNDLQAVLQDCVNNIKENE